MRSLHVRGFALALAVIVVAGCSKVAAPDGTTPTRHAYTHAHELRFAAAEDLVGLNPLIVSQTTLNYLANMTMAYLIKTDRKGDPTVPELITEIPTKANGDISHDGKAITWKLRHGVVWSDGKPFTADDVVFSTKLILNPKTNTISLDGWDQIVKIDEPDKYTVVYHLKAPYAPFSSTYFSSAGANPAIMPQHLLAGKNINNDPYNSLPVGIGPFKYQEWKRGDSVVLVPNPTYFRGAPKLQKVTYELVQDRNTVLQLLRTHEIDIWLPVPAHFINDVRGIAGVKTILEPSYYYDHLDFNMSHPIVQDLAVRQAIRLAMDRKTVNDKIRYGVFDLGESIVPPLSHFHENIPFVPFDVAAANARLDKAGWARGADGIRAKNGIRLSLNLASSTGSPDTDQQIEIFRSSFTKIGIDLQVKRYQSSLLFAPASAGGIVYSGKFDMIVFAWGGSPNQDLANLYACYRFPPNGQNDLRYCNRNVTNVIDRGSKQYDTAERDPGMRFLQRQIFADAPTIVLDTRKEIDSYNDDLEGWHPNPVAPMDDMKDVDI